MTPLEREYRYLIYKALEAGDDLKATSLQQWGMDHHGLPLQDALHPTLWQRQQNLLAA